MPYGIDKKLGGDSPKNVSWMERCVSRVQGQTDKKGRKIDKSRAIAICKATMRKSKASDDETIELDFDAMDFELSYMLATKEWLEPTSEE